MADKVIQIGNDSNVQSLLDCEQRGKNHSNQRPPSICMVPSVLRDLSPRSFEPRVVSIGPLHSKDSNLEKFEGQKESYLHDLLHGLDSQREQTLEACVQKVNASIDRIKACYPDTYNDVASAKMMVMDGCFIIEFLIKYLQNDKSLMQNQLLVKCIAMDLMLVENQIPFFVLQDIFDCIASKFRPTTSHTTKILPHFLKGINPLTSMLHHVLGSYIKPFDDKLKIGNVPFDEKLKIGNVGTDVTHILALLHKFYDSADAKPSRGVTVPTAHSALELDRSGVNFKPNQEINWSIAMKFESSSFVSFPWSWHRPTLRMPKLVIEDDTELVLRNFIAYEQSFPQVHYYFTSYAYAMDKLIDTREDVAKLVESEVLANHLGSNKEAAKMINDLCKEISLVEFYYADEWQQLDEYYNDCWPNTIAGLRRRYFSSPWNAIALLAGIILFALTVVQTFFTIKAT